MPEQSKNDAGRVKIQQAVDRFVAKRATEADFNILRDRELMYCATGDQMCAFIQAVPKQDDLVPMDVMYAVAEMLRIRWMQSPHQTKKQTPRLPNGRATFRAPAGWR